MHAQRHRTVLLHVTKSIFHLVSVMVSVRCRLDIEKLSVIDVFLIEKTSYFSCFILQLLFIGYALIDASAADIAVSANFHIISFQICSWLEPAVSIIKFFFVFEESVFFYGFSDVFHSLHQEMEIMVSHQH